MNQDQDPAEIRQYVLTCSVYLRLMDKATLMTQSDAESGNCTLHKKVTDSHLLAARSYTFLDATNVRAFPLFFTK
jgi:hypothetical protein